MALSHRREMVEGAIASAGGPAPPATKYAFGRVTDVSFDPQGNIFVSDGYVNHRVVKYDRNGWFVAQVGSERPGSEPSQFSTPHGIAVGRIIGRFGRAGKPLKEFDTVNAIDCRSENELWVGEIGNWRVQKLTLRPKS